PLQRPPYRGPLQHHPPYNNTNYPPQDPRYQQQQLHYPGNGYDQYGQQPQPQPQQQQQPQPQQQQQQQQPYGSEYGQEYYQDPQYQQYSNNGYEHGPGYGPPHGPGYGPSGPPAFQGRPGAGLTPSSSVRVPPLGRGGGPRPMMMGPGGPGPPGGGPYGGRPPHMGPSGRGNGAGAGPGPGPGSEAAGGASRKRPLSYEVLDEMRHYAKESQNPVAQLDYAKALIEAAVTFGHDDPDHKRQKKNKEALFMEGLKIIKRLATGMGLGRPAFPEAQFFLANCYGNGALGLQIDHDKAFNLYLQASKQNHPASTYRIGVCYELGAGTKRDYSRAIQFYRKAAASLGDTSAMYKLGMVYLKGLLGQQ
ncbi:hypothetical protein BGZ65_012074, partial [Modicella reniformis]